MHLIDPNNYYLNDVFWDFLDASDELPEDNHFIYIENFDLSKNISSVIKKIKDCEINCGYACHYRNQKISWHAPIFEYSDKTILYMKKNNIFAITHPGDKGKVDIEKIAKVARETNTLLEINSSHGYLSSNDLRLISDNMFIVGSDAHQPERVGDFELAINNISQANINLDQIQNLCL